jgi:hypothetical protein
MLLFVENLCTYRSFTTTTATGSTARCWALPCRSLQTTSSALGLCLHWATYTQKRLTQTNDWIRVHDLSVWATDYSSCTPLTARPLWSACTDILPILNVPLTIMTANIRTVAASETYGLHAMYHTQGDVVCDLSPYRISRLALVVH